jgi:hypothetical protein
MKLVMFSHKQCSIVFTSLALKIYINFESVHNEYRTLRSIRRAERVTHEKLQFLIRERTESS